MSTDKAKQKLNNIAKQYDCVDNKRIVKDGECKQEYYQQQIKGCCGYFDKEIVIDGIVYLIGFNYGH